MALDWLAQWLILVGFVVNAARRRCRHGFPMLIPRRRGAGRCSCRRSRRSRGLCVVARLSGTEPLIYIGLFMVFYGILYALLENDMRRILAY